MTSNPNILDILRQHSSQQSLPAHTFLFHQGDPLRDIYLLEKGLVKMTRGERNGQEVTLELRSAINILGAASALANEPAPMTAITITPSKVHRLSVKEFLHLAKSDEIFLHNLIESVSRQRNEQVNLRAQQSLLHARPRLAMLLLQFAQESGVERKGQLSLALPIAKQEIAAMLGITPQRLSNILKEMKQAGVIAEEKGWIIFSDMQALKSEAETGEKSR